jgi:hypothetical protein
MVPGMYLVLIDAHFVTVPFFLLVAVFLAGQPELMCLRDRGRVSIALFLPNMVNFCFACSVCGPAFAHAVPFSSKSFTSLSPSINLLQRPSS